MNSVQTWMQKNKLSLIGIAVGAIGGFMYWNYIGCASGTCMITSKPIITVCQSGARSGMAKGILKSAGIEVYNGGSWFGLRSKI